MQCSLQGACYGLDMYIRHLYDMCFADVCSVCFGDKTFEEVSRQGLVRSIGVSNFGNAHIQKLMDTATIKLAVNQIELTPFLQRKEIVEYCDKAGILLQVCYRDCQKLVHWMYFNQPRSSE